MANIELITNIVGYAATLCLVCGYLPQALMTIRTRNTEGISMTSWIFMTLGSIFFVTQGSILHNWPLVIANSITAVCSIAIFCIKLHNDYKKRHTVK